MPDYTPVCSVLVVTVKTQQLPEFPSGSPLDTVQVVGLAVSFPTLLRLSSASAFRVRGGPQCWSRLRLKIRHSAQQLVSLKL